MTLVPYDSLSPLTSFSQKHRIITMDFLSMNDKKELTLLYAKMKSIVVLLN